MRDEVTLRCFGSLYALDSCIGVDIERAGGKNVLDILGSLSDITLDIHGETGRFGNSESEVQGHAAGKTAEADEQTPAVVDMLEVVEGVVDDSVLESGDNDKRDKGGSCIGFVC